MLWPAAEFVNLIQDLVSQEGGIDAQQPTTKHLTKMYTEAVEDTQEIEEYDLVEDAISPAAFVATVQRHGLMHVHHGDQGVRTQAIRQPCVCDFWVDI